jgi:hypothetical protein
MIVFAESLHYSCKPDILAGNSIAIYKAMYKHLFGKQTSDVQQEVAKFDNHKVDFRMNLRQNIDTLEQLITNVDHASDRKFTNNEHNQLISNKFADDTRRGHAAIFLLLESLSTPIMSVLQRSFSIPTTSLTCNLPRLLRGWRTSREVSSIFQVWKLSSWSSLPVPP